MQDPASPREFHSGGCVIAPATRRLLRDGSEVEVEAKVLDLIVLLVEGHERALGKREIIDALWGRRPITDAALSQLIYKARRACGDDGGQQQVIRTIYGRGLQWVAPVREVVAERAAPAAEPGDPVPASEAPANQPAVVPALVGGAPALPRQPDRAAPAAARRRTPWLIGAAVLALAVLGAGLAWWLVPRGVAGAAPALPRVALLPIENATGDATLDWAVRGLPGLMGSLLDQSRGLDVIDPLQVARAWDFAIPPAGNRVDHTRDVTHASVLVSGNLRKLGSLYELSLQVDRGPRHGRAEITMAGPEPGALAVAAVPRIRRALELPQATRRASGNAPADPYLSQTFARGMDAGMHGRWQDAKPYFALCVKEAPDFAPCRLRLGQAQTHSDELPEARRTLQAALDVARADRDGHATAQVLVALAGIDLVGNAAADALQLLQQAAPLAQRAGDVELEASIALKSANAAAVLKRTPLAERELARARRWIGEHHLREMESALHNSESFLAYSRGDFAGAAAADRAALQASLAIGDEFGAAADTHNLALALLRADRPLEALPLFADALRRGEAIGNLELGFSAGNNLATILLEAGLHERARPVIDRLVDTAERQGGATWQAYALSLRSDARLAAGNAAGALDDARKAAALVGAKQDPWLAAALRFKSGLIALFEDRGSLGALARQFDSMVGAQPHPEEYAYAQQLVRALAAAASGDAASARAALRIAGAAGHPDDPSGYDLRRAALAIALATRDREAGGIALQGFDPGRCNVADVLAMAGRWARLQGDPAAARAHDEHRAALGERVLDALQKAGPVSAIALSNGPET